MKDEGGLRRQLEKVGVIHLEEVGLQILIKGGLVEFDLLFFHIDVGPGKPVRHLRVHILLVTHLGKLRPEGDIHAHGQRQPFFQIGMGQNPHARG